MNDLQKWIALGIGVAGVVAAGAAFKGRFKTVEKKGLTLASGLLLVVAVGTLVTRFESTINDAKQLLA